MGFPFYKQYDEMDCGPTCLRMVAKYHGRAVSLDYLRKKSEYSKEGVSLLGLADAAESIGLRSVGAKITFDQLVEDVPLPAILHWNQFHYVVLTPGSRKDKLMIADPSNGMVKLSREDFLKQWASTTEGEEKLGVALLLETTPTFFEPPEEQAEEKKVIGWNFLFSYCKKHRKALTQVLAGMLLGSLVQLIFPYMTQSIVDTGIRTRSTSFITTILLAQFMLFFSRTFIDFLRTRILLYISMRINISLLSSLWSKLLRLPMVFYDSKHPGDILQRIGDQDRIEKFLTGSAVGSLFALVNLALFSIVLLTYDVTIFLVFLGGSLVYFKWIFIFLKQRKVLDYKRFALAARETNCTMQLVHGMQEVKLNSAENMYRWKWESLQAGLFKLNFKSLSLMQYQQAGAFFINEGKNLVITYLVALSVINGELTLGAMLAIQFIVSQLNAPIEQLIQFVQQAQDARLSLERLNDIHVLEDEEPADRPAVHALPASADIHIQNLTFGYPGAGNEPVLKNINLVIPQNKVTAIVGMSGSGKTTLLKLLLRFYENYTGTVKLGDMNFRLLSQKFWRRKVGCVMQDGFIFSDTISRNITVADERPIIDDVMQACHMANIRSFIDSLPLGLYTKIGAEGTSLSAGQRQRLFIARAVYKDPAYLFFDEATNALDANNEKTILENLDKFFRNRTVVVVAHRLSTVKNADKIVVLDQGMIVEEGTHLELTARKGKYYELVKNQLELGN
jgi:ATP-binding cassette subfamily B protein